MSYQGKTFLAIIPARGGSQRLSNKNILDFAGQPLIARAIQAGRDSKYIDRCIVSTDSEQITEISRQYGADIPFKRPERLATDKSSTFDVVKHVIENLDQIYDFVVLIQPTSPLRLAKHLDKSIEYAMSKQADAVISVTALSHPIEWTNTLDHNLSMTGFFDAKYQGKRSQDFPSRYRIDGAIYINQVNRLLQEQSFIYDGLSYAYVLEYPISIDIDRQIDFDMALFFASRQ